MFIKVDTQKMKFGKEEPYNNFRVNVDTNSLLINLSSANAMYAVDNFLQVHFSDHIEFKIEFKDVKSAKEAEQSIYTHMKEGAALFEINEGVTKVTSLRM